MLNQLRYTAVTILACAAFVLFFASLNTYEYGLSTLAGGTPLSSQEEMRAQLLLLSALLCGSMATLLFVFKNDVFWLSVSSIGFAILYVFLSILAIGYGNSYNEDLISILNSGVQYFGGEGVLTLLLLLLLSPILATICYLTYASQDK